jgi:hypothetical protein
MSILQVLKKLLSLLHIGFVSLQVIYVAQGTLDALHAVKTKIMEYCLNYKECLIVEEKSDLSHIINFVLLD